MHTLRLVSILLLSFVILHLDFTDAECDKKEDSSPCVDHSKNDTHVSCPNSTESDADKHWYCFSSVSWFGDQKMSYTKTGSMFKTCSPWLCQTGINIFNLTFRYVQQSKASDTYLNVSMVKKCGNNNAEVLWSNKNYNSFQNYTEVSLNITSPDCAFQVQFETEESMENMTYVDEISLEYTYLALHVPLGTSEKTSGTLLFLSFVYLLVLTPLAIICWVRCERRQKAEEGDVEEVSANPAQPERTSGDGSSGQPTATQETPAPGGTPVTGAQVGRGPQVSPFPSGGTRKNSADTASTASSSNFTTFTPSQAQPQPQPPLLTRPPQPTPPPFPSETPAAPATTTSAPPRYSPLAPSDGDGSDHEYVDPEDEGAVGGENYLQPIEGPLYDYVVGSSSSYLAELGPAPRPPLPPRGLP